MKKRFKRGMSVVVMEGVMDPDDSGITIGGWTGFISEVVSQELVEVTWDGTTIQKMSLSQIKIDEEEGFDWTRMYLYPEDLKITDTFFSATDTERVIRNTKKSLENMNILSEDINTFEDEDILTDENIKKNIPAYSNMFVDGLKLYNEGMVKKLEYYTEDNSFEAIVEEFRNSFSVRIEFDSVEYTQSVCNCPTFHYYRNCKHTVAALKKIQKNWKHYVEELNRVRITNKTRPFLDFFKNNINGINVNITDETKVLRQETSEVVTKLIPTFCFTRLNNGMRSWLEFSIGDSKKMYVLKNISDFLNNTSRGKKTQFGAKFTFIPGYNVFDEKSKALFDIVNTVIKDESQFEVWRDYRYTALSAFSDAKRFRLSKSNMEKFFDIMGDDEFEIMSETNKHFGKVTKDRPLLNISVKPLQIGVETGIEIELVTKNGIYINLDNEYTTLYFNGTIYRIDEEFSKSIRPLLDFYMKNNENVIKLPSSEASNVFSTIIPRYERIGNVKIDASFSNHFKRETLETSVYLDKAGAGVSATIQFKYGDVVINPLSDIAEQEQKTVGQKQLIRSSGEEMLFTNLLDQFGFSKQKEDFVQQNEEGAYSFLKEGLPRIKEMAEVFYSESFKSFRIKDKVAVKAGVRLNTGTGLIEMTLKYEDMHPEELFDLLAQYKIKKKYYRLKSGEFVSLENSDLNGVATMLEQLNITSGDLSKKVIELPKYRALYIDAIARDLEGVHIERNIAFKRMVQDIREPEDVEYEIPNGITGTLRDYQKIGFKWLKTLANYGLGGILADDMGLGKTLQAITFILSEKETEQMPSLVIAPTSLVYNWREEVKKFAPGLKVAVVSGVQGERKEILNDIDEADIVITSYALIKRDIEIYNGKKFKYCFIDEAQNIKNPNTLNSKSVKKINAKGYFALTGTPVENTLTELWSIFDFLMPHYLLTHNKFVTKYEAPIVKNRDSKVLHELGKHIHPFILRRMKKDVLKELPEKVESKMTNEMTEAQKKVYAAYLVSAKREFETEIKTNGFAKSQIKILAIITRLRQICCHPSLFIENYSGGSGKLEMLIEIIHDAIDSGHRILLFSQFTSMLDIIKDELKNTSITYHYLDGSTPSEDRIKLVNSFNSGERDMFLLSLKAGGTGLNLTGADMVIHYDPWWNPAVEDQATDRAYRIGQKNSVQVFKLITKDTIEEKIYELQIKKKELIDAVIKPGENFLTKMSEAQLRDIFEA